MLDRLHPRLPRAAFAAALLAVLVLSLLPPSAGSVVTVGWDKANHASGFLVLGVLGLAAHPGRTVPVAAGLLGFGVLIEVLQGMTTWRSAEAADLLADGVGILAACALVALMRRAGVPWLSGASREAQRRGAPGGPPTA